MITYDRSVLEALADALYQQAARIQIAYSLLGAGAGFVAAYNFVDGRGPEQLIGGLVGAGFGAAIGFALSTARAATLRVQAQTLLCQVQIEINTDRAAKTLASMSLAMPLGELSQPTPKEPALEEAEAAEKASAMAGGQSDLASRLPPPGRG